MNINLSGYKLLGAKANVKLSNLTILIGKNGVGKSSFTHLLKKLKESFQNEMGSFTDLLNHSINLDLDATNVARRNLRLSLDAVVVHLGELNFKINLLYENSNNYYVESIEVHQKEFYKQHIFANKYSGYIFKICRKDNWEIDLAQFIDLNIFREFLYIGLVDTGPSSVINKKKSRKYVSNHLIENLYMWFSDNVDKKYLVGLIENEYPEFYNTNYLALSDLYLLDIDNPITVKKGKQTSFSPENRGNIKLFTNELSKSKNRNHDILTKNQVFSSKSLELLLETELKDKIESSNIVDDERVKAYMKLLSNHKLKTGFTDVEYIYQDISTALKNLDLEIVNFDYIDFFKENLSINVVKKQRDICKQHCENLDIFYDDFSDYLYDYWTRIKYSDTDLVFNKIIRNPIISSIQFIEDAFFRSMNQFKTYLFVPQNIVFSKRSISIESPASEFEKLCIKWYRSSSDKFDFVSSKIKEFGLGEELIVDNKLPGNLFLYLRKETRQGMLCDEGSGVISLVQLFMSLEIAINSDEYTTVVVEEPEANLHPALQSKLADLFADFIMKYKLKLIVETHSEYFIRKLQYLIAKGEMDHSKAIVNYFEVNHDNQEASETDVFHYKFNKEGKIDLAFKEKFMDESHRLKIELYKVNINRVN